MKKLDHFHRRICGILQICFPNGSQGIWWAYQSQAAIINKQHNVDTWVGQLPHYGRKRGPHPFASTPVSFPCGLYCVLLCRIQGTDGDWTHKADRKQSQEQVVVSHTAWSQEAESRQKVGEVLKPPSLSTAPIHWGRCYLLKTPQLPKTAPPSRCQVFKHLILRCLKHFTFKVQHEDTCRSGWKATLMTSS